jgi:ankyrin repeat protein
MLVNAGADVNAAATEYKGRTALQAATENSYFKMVKMLLNAGADVNTAAAGYKGLTAL